MAAKKRIPQLLEGKAVNSACELCTENKWQLPAEDMAEVRLAIAEPGGAISFPGPSFNAHFMICSNCGNVRLHASQIIDPSSGGGR